MNRNAAIVVKFDKPTRVKLLPANCAFTSRRGDRQFFRWCSRSLGASAIKGGDEHNPQAIYVQMSGMGDGGPWSKFVTYAPTIHALAWLTHTTGANGREDIGIGFSYNDHQQAHELLWLFWRRWSNAIARVLVTESTSLNLKGVNFLDRHYSIGLPTVPLPAQWATIYPTTPQHPTAVTPQLQYLNPDNIPGLGERWIAIACMTDTQWSALKALMNHPQKVGQSKRTRQRRRQDDA